MDFCEKKNGPNSPDFEKKKKKHLKSPDFSTIDFYT
jgi:hypothetical protein